MTDRFPWTVTTYPEGSSLMAECVRPGCGGVRYLPRSYLLEVVGDIPLLDVERRARCVEPGCRGAMRLEWVPRPAMDGTSEELEERGGASRRATSPWPAPSP